MTTSCSPYHVTVMGVTWEAVEQFSVTDPLPSSTAMVDKPAGPVRLGFFTCTVTRRGHVTQVPS